MGGPGPVQKERKEEGFYLTIDSSGPMRSLSTDQKKLLNSLGQDAGGRFHIEFTSSKKQDRNLYRLDFEQSGFFHPSIDLEPFKFEARNPKTREMENYAAYPRLVQDLQVRAGISLTSGQKSALPESYAHISHVSDGSLFKSYGKVKRTGSDSKGEYVRLLQDTGTNAKIYLSDITQLRTYGKAEPSFD